MTLLICHQRANGFVGRLSWNRGGWGRGARQNNADDVLRKNTSNFILTSALILLFYRSGSAVRLLMTCAQRRVTRFNWSIANHQCEFYFNKIILMWFRLAALLENCKLSPYDTDTGTERTSDFTSPVWLPSLSIFQNDYHKRYQLIRINWFRSKWALVLQDCFPGSPLVETCLPFRHHTSSIYFPRSTWEHVTIPLDSIESGWVVLVCDIIIS